MTAGAGSDRSFSLGYRPELDGLRAIAVCLVLLVHMEGSPIARGGAIGVNIFFVLSGFLITALLLIEHERVGRIGLRNFYIRRALRLFPALAALLAALLFLVVLCRVVAVPGYGPEKTEELWTAIPLTALYVANWASALNLAEMGALSHTWSLAIEEQFYLLWPIALILLLRRGTRVSRIAAGLIVLSLAVGIERYIIWQTYGADRAYFGSDTRSDALLFGCAVAAISVSGGLPHSGTALRWLQMFGCAGAALVTLVALTTSKDDPKMYSGGYTAAGIATALVIAALIASPRGPAHRALAVAPLVGIGRISYGLYLWHVPIFQVVRDDTVAKKIAETALAFAVTIGCYYLIERPALRLKSRFQGVRDEGRAASPAALPVDMPLRSQSHPSMPSSRPL